MTNAQDNCSKNRLASVEAPYPGRVVLALESTGLYKGVYHVLLGRIAPLEGVDPEDVTIEPLLHRLAGGEITELIMVVLPEVTAAFAFAVKVLAPTMNLAQNCV